MPISLSKSKAIPIRKIFPKEDRDFTPWLSKQENLDHLGEVLGMDLELEKTEARVGTFSLDILCKNKTDKSLVAIENQIEKTDHAHLGQLLTYGVGLGTSTMIWIAATFTEEHRQALKWLNKHTDKKFRFFGVKVEAKQIDNSNPAIDFNIICKPIDWLEPGTRGANKKNMGTLTPMDELKKRYWQGLEKYMADQGSKLTGQTPGPKQSQWFNIGRGGTGIRLKINIIKNTARLEIYLNGKKTCKAFFNLLKKDKQAIERGFPFKLNWQEFPEKAYSSIGINIINMDIKNEGNWVNEYKNLKDMIENFDEAFTHRILALDLNDWNPTAPK